MGVRATLGLVALTVLATPVHARVFNYNDAFVSSFLRGTGQLSAVAQDPFGNSSGTDTTISEDTKFGYSGELGLSFNFTPTFHLRVGAEVIQHRPVKEAQGLNPSGAERFTLDSSVFVFNPNVTFEYVYSQRGVLRFFTYAGVGMADVTVENRYTMTATGTTDLGVGSFNEKMSGSSLSGHFGLGLETLFVDNVTFSFDVGYRHLPVQKLKHKGSANTIVNPSGVAKGDEVVNHDGSKRTMDLGGLTMGVAFRFYLNFF